MMMMMMMMMMITIRKTANFSSKFRDRISINIKAVFLILPSFGDK